MPKTTPTTIQKIPIYRSHLKTESPPTFPPSLQYSRFSRYQSNNRRKAAIKNMMASSTKNLSKDLPFPFFRTSYSRVSHSQRRLTKSSADFSQQQVRSPCPPSAGEASALFLSFLFSQSSHFPPQLHLVSPFPTVPFKPSRTPIFFSFRYLFS